MEDRGRLADQRLAELLTRWVEADAAERDGIEQRIHTEFEHPLAILVIDMSGFSSSVVRHGIIHFLAKVHHMRSVTVPVIQRHGGEVVKYIADDVMATFPTADGAVAAGIEILRASLYDDLDTPDDMRFDVSIGIGYGPILEVPRTDLWGDEVNRAFKLGEDTAEAGELLISEGAWNALAHPPDAERLELSVSGVELVAYAVRFPTR